MTELDALARARPFLNQCGSCDIGLPVTCTCPPGNYKSVMLDLVREIERLRERLPVEGPHCPRCGSQGTPGPHDVCQPCAVAEGWERQP